MKKLVLFLIFFLSNSISIFATAIAPATVISPATSGARSKMCQDLFDTGELEKSIRGLAKLRMQLDVAKAHANRSLSFATLDSQYKEKEQSTLDHVLKNNLMSQADFFKMISLEIAALQTDESKIETKKDQQSREIENLVPGRQILFHEFNSQDEEIRTYEVMTTPTTQVIWKKIAELINSKLESKFHVHSSPAKVSGDLFPITNVSYTEIVKWVSGLNELSKIEDVKLKDIIPDHQNGHIYKLPSEREWITFLKIAYHDPIDTGNFSFKPDEEVSTTVLMNVSDQKYYGLSHLRQFLERVGVNNFTNYAVPYIMWIRERKRYEFDVRQSGVSFDYRDDSLSFRLIRRKAPL